MIIIVIGHRCFCHHGDDHDYAKDYKDALKVEDIVKDGGVRKDEGVLKDIDVCCILILFEDKDDCPGTPVFSRSCAHDPLTDLKDSNKQE